jgi:hypothetical protein
MQVPNCRRQTSIKKEFIRGISNVIVGILNEHFFWAGFRGSAFPGKEATDERSKKHPWFSHGST